jgi:hypothetical protein
MIKIRKEIFCSSAGFSYFLRVGTLEEAQALFGAGHFIVIGMRDSAFYYHVFVYIIR